MSQQPLTPEERAALQGPEHNNHPDFETVEDTVIGNLTFGTIKRAVNGHPLHYIHIHSTSGKDGEVWGDAAILVDQCAISLDAGQFAVAIEDSLVYMGGDISSRVTERLNKAKASSFATSLEGYPDMDVAAPAESIDFDVELTKAGKRRQQANARTRPRAGKPVVHGSLLDKLIKRV